MEHKTENNRLAEKKKRKKKLGIYNNHHNKVAQKLIDDQKEKLLNTAKNHFKNEPCSSSTQNIVVTRSKYTPTFHGNNIHQNCEQFNKHFNPVPNDFINKLHSTFFDLDLCKVVEQSSSFQKDGITLDIDSGSNTNIDKKEISSSDIKNNTQENILKDTNLTQFVSCEDTRFVRCCYCHIVICYDVLLLIEHAKKCKKCIETKLNYIKQFNCIVCDVTTKLLKDWKTHAIGTSHLDKCMNKNDFVSYYCCSCKIVLFGSKETILNHCKNIHKNPSGLPSIFKCIKDVFYDFINDSQKCWTFCSPCKLYSSSSVNCFSFNHKNRNTKHFKCNTCSIDFISNKIVYNQHLISCEHYMLEHLRAKAICKSESLKKSNLKLPLVFLNKFTIDNEKASCNDCKFLIVPSEKTIMVHLTECTLKPTKSKIKNTISIQKYFCVVCNETISDFNQWKFHLILPNHLIKCHGFNDLISYTCEICLLHCYGSEHHAIEHQSIHPNKSEKTISAFLAFNYKRINNDLKSKEFYYCEDCETYAEVNSSDHWNKSHKNKLKRMVCRPCRIEFFCIEGNNLFDRHVLTSEHIILNYVTTKNTFEESKTSILKISQKLSVLNDTVEKSDSRSILQTKDNSRPLITKPYSNWFFEDKNKAVCMFCDDILETSENVLFGHFLACKQYSKKNVLEKNIIYFKCLECAFHSATHKSWETHAVSHINLDICGLYSYFCKMCCCLLYGKMNDIELHLNSEHMTVFSEMPLETVLMAKQLMRRNNTSFKSSDMCFCEPCKKIFKVLDNPSHFNTDSHLLGASDTVELFYCKYCQVEFYSSSLFIECHKLTVEHIILKSMYSKFDGNDNDVFKPSKLNDHLLKFVTNQKLYVSTQDIGFFCFICNHLCLNLHLWKTHVNGKKHTNSSKHFTCIDHYCKICKTLMFGQRKDIFYHYNNRLHTMLKQFKVLTSINIENKIPYLLQKNGEVKSICSMDTTFENNKTINTDSNLIGKAPNIEEISSFKKIMDKLSVQLNDDLLLDCCKLDESANSNDETHSVINTSDLILESSTKDNIELNINSVKNLPIKNTTDEITLESNTKNYSHFYELKLKIFKEMLNQNNEIVPQCVYYCVPCDFITAVKSCWDKHNITDHSNEIEVRHKVFCDICNLYQFGPLDNLDKHYKTIDHKNMIDFAKQNDENNIKNLNKKTKEKSENESNLVSSKPLDNIGSSVTKKQEISNNKIDEKETIDHKIMIEIKGAKSQYKKNSWTELKKIFASYGYFGLYPKKSNAIIIFRKMSSATLMLKDKEKLEKTHDFIINVLIEEDKLPELPKITEYEFGNYERLLHIINTQLLAINLEISNSDIAQRLILLINSIHRCAGQHFLDGKIYAFGSRMSGLALKDSDVDLYFDIANTFYGSLSNDLYAQEDLVRYFGKVFRSQNKEFKQVQPITGARVPIVKFFHLPSGLNCDLSFKSGLSTHNTKLVRLYLTLDEHVHWVVCAVVKRWALQNNLKNQTMFTSYALAWLVLFYLMTIEVVPPLMLLRNNAVYSKNVPWNQMSDEMFIEDWDCTFCTSEKAKLIWKVPKISRWDLLFGFFKFYADHNRLKTFVFCPVIGKAIPKKQFFDIPLTNPDLLGFNKKRTGNATQWCNKLRNNFSGEGLAVQDPFDLFHNITKIIVPRKLQAFSHLCNKTLEVMTGATQPYYA